MVSSVGTEQRGTRIRKELRISGRSPVRELHKQGGVK